MKKLPKLYTNTFDKKIDNSQEYTKVVDKIKEESIPTNNYEINKKIDNIFKSNNYIYKIKAKLFLKDKERTETLIGKTNNNLITINNELININDIKDIRKAD